MWSPDIGTFGLKTRWRERATTRRWLLRSHHWQCAPCAPKQVYSRLRGAHRPASCDMSNGAAPAKRTSRSPTKKCQISTTHYFPILRDYCYNRVSAFDPRFHVKHSVIIQLMASKRNSVEQRCQQISSTRVILFRCLTIKSFNVVFKEFGGQYVSDRPVINVFVARH